MNLIAARSWQWAEVARNKQNFTFINFNAVNEYTVNENTVTWLYLYSFPDELLS